MVVGWKDPSLVASRIVCSISSYLCIFLDFYFLPFPVFHFFLSFSIVKLFRLLRADESLLWLLELATSYIVGRQYLFSAVSYLPITAQTWNEPPAPGRAFFLHPSPSPHCAEVRLALTYSNTAIPPRAHFGEGGEIMLACTGLTGFGWT